MPEAKQIAVRGKVALIEGQVDSADRPAEYTHLQGIAVNPTSIDGEGKALLSIWKRGDTQCKALTLEHDELVTLLTKLSEVHDLICPHNDGGTVQ
jgi:hypothetical protein